MRFEVFNADATDFWNLDVFVPERDIDFVITDLLINEIDKYYKNLEKDNEVLILEGVRKTYLEEKPGFFAVFNNKGNYIINKKIMEAWIDYLTGDIDVNELEIELAYEEKRLTNEEKEIYEKIKSLLERKAIA